MMIYNIDKECFESYDDALSVWMSVDCTACDVPDAPTSTSPSDISSTGFTANWSSVSEATDYYLDVATDNLFTSFVSGFDNYSAGNSSSVSVTGLTCETTYYYRVRAENSCGISESGNVSSETTSACEPSYPQDYVHCGGTPTAVVEVVSNTGKTWMDRNLGASQIATSSTDELAYGSLFQWGRFADGHQCLTSATTSAVNSSDTPGHGYFILRTGLPFDWRMPQNNNLWQGANGINNPCPSGYRIPTEAEWSDEISSWTEENLNGAFESSLKLTVSGYRLQNNGELGETGERGFYWSSDINSTEIYSRDLLFGVDEAIIYNGLRATGFSVRCIKD